MTLDQVPAPLRPWIGWAMYEREESLCPFLEGVAAVRCAWPARLALALDDKGGRFTQSWRTEAHAWVPLPGDARRWPQQITVDGAPAVAVPVGDALSPGVRLERGDHVVAGTFLWDSLPESVPIPVETGLLSLTVRGAAVDSPQREGGTLWLQRNTEAATEGDRLEVSVHRLIADDVPMLLTTRIELGVSGKSREEVLGKALPPGFVPLSLDSPLPTRLEADSRLRVQVRPGTYVIMLTARSEKPVSALTRPAPEGTWREGQEVWVFDARPMLRHVTVEGVDPMDPQQTSLPEEWKRLPAYPMDVGATLKFLERRRGDAAPPPDQLSLNRELWLDFDGKGYTVRDSISGQLSRAWRLEMTAPAMPGRVAVDGRDVFITRGENGRAGVEVRRGSVQVSADSRLEGGITDLPATGWASDFHSASAVMHLPPGWKLLESSGVDEASPSWRGAYTLLDLFLILVVALAAWRLLGLGWGILALFALGLSVVEPGAPRWAWLLVLGARPLVRLLPEKWPKRLARLAHLGLSAVLSLMVVAFVAREAQAGLYPAVVKEPAHRIELGDSFKTVTDGTEGWTRGARRDTTVDFDEGLMGGERAATGSPGPAAPAAATVPAAPRPVPAKRKAISNFGSNTLNAQDYDPNAAVQTGPGIPTWEQYNTTLYLKWNGPVPAGQRMHLYLLSPLVNLLLAILRSALVALLLLALWRFPGRFWPARLKGTVPALGLLLALLVAPPSAAAQEVPPPELLVQLGDRLTAPPECQQHCASSPRLILELGPGTFTVRMEVSAATATGVPLPGAAPDLVPSEVLLDGRPATALARDAEGHLWIALSPGQHQIVATGKLPARDSLPVALPMLPHRVEAHVTGWRIDGLHEDGIADDTLLLSRLGGAQAAPTALQATALPPFVRVERTITMGLRWGVSTQVVRASPPGVPVVLEVPLLAGESVTTAGVRVVGGKVLVNLGPNDSAASWASSLEERSPLRLIAPAAAAQTEVWRLEAGPIWHVTLSGIVPARSFGDDGTRRPEWWPWPGEEATITASRPDGLPGQILTADHSKLELWPGPHSTEAKLELSLRSSRSSEHTLTLPPDAVLEAITLNGVSQAVRQEGRKVVLPVARGAQTFQIGWRQPEGGLSVLSRGLEVDLGIGGVNSDCVMHVPQDRFVLAAGGGAGLGPSVQLWALLVALVLAAAVLGQLRSTPLRLWHWLLLGLGCVQLPWQVGILLVGMLLLIGWRASSPDLGKVGFNLRQVALVGLSAIALLVLVGAVISGLSGQPEMSIAGNGSSSALLRWTEDRIGNQLPRPWMVTLPVWAWRVAMGVWGLWLGVMLVGWCKWAWRTFTEGGAWRPLGLWKWLTTSAPKPAAK